MTTLNLKIPDIRKDFIKLGYGIIGLSDIRPHDLILRSNQGKQTWFYVRPNSIHNIYSGSSIIARNPHLTHIWANMNEQCRKLTLIDWTEPVTLCYSGNNDIWWLGKVSNSRGFQQLKIGVPPNHYNVQYSSLILDLKTRLWDQYCDGICDAFGFLYPSIREL